MKAVFEFNCAPLEMLMVKNMRKPQLLKQLGFMFIAMKTGYLEWEPSINQCAW